MLLSQCTQKSSDCLFAVAFNCERRNRSILLRLDWAISGPGGGR